MQYWDRLWQKKSFLNKTFLTIEEKRRTRGSTVRWLCLSEIGHSVFESLLLLLHKQASKCFSWGCNWTTATLICFSFVSISKNLVIQLSLLSSIQQITEGSFTTAGIQSSPLFHSSIELGKIWYEVMKIVDYVQSGDTSLGCIRVQLCFHSKHGRKKLL